MKRSGRTRGSCREGERTLADPAQEYAHDLAVKRVLQHLVLAAGFDARVVVDLDDVAALADELEVDAIEPVADQVGGAQRRIDHDARRFTYGKRGRSSLAMPVGRVVV